MGGLWEGRLRGSDRSCDEIVAGADEERDCRIGDLSRLNIITARETSVLSSPIQSLMLVCVGVWVVEGVSIVVNSFVPGPLDVTPCFGHRRTVRWFSLPLTNVTVSVFIWIAEPSTPPDLYFPTGCDSYEATSYNGFPTGLA